MANDRDDAVPPHLDFDWRAITPDDSPKTLPDIMADPKHRELAEAELGVGDPAHDFSLPVLDASEGGERETGEVFHLQARAGARPVALIFGSYT